MKKGTRLLHILLLVAVMMAMMPFNASAASKSPGKPKITSVTVSENTVTVNVKKVKKAKSYRLYSVTYTPKWKYHKTVKASKKNKYSDVSKYKLVKKGKKYKVYKMASEPKYTQLVKVDGTTLSFTGQWGTAYTLSVRAYSGKKGGAYSAVKTVQIGNIPASTPSPTEPANTDPVPGPAPSPTPTPIEPADTDPVPGPAPSPTEPANTESYETYAFFGSDSRANDESWKSLDGGKITADTLGSQGTPRSDVIMLINVDRSKEKIDIISIYRDTALNESAEGINFQKANKAYADYGPEEACRVLERNLNIKIKGYAASNFKGVADVIDDLFGDEGVPADGLNEELTYFKKEVVNADAVDKPCVVDQMNEYIAEMNSKYVDRKDEPFVIKGSDKQNLSGLQAVGYARVRYTAGSDMKRTVRQRKILLQMIKKYKKLDAKQKIELFVNNASAIDTNLGLKELAELVRDVSGYTIEEDLTKAPGFPYYKNSYKKNTSEEEGGVSELIVPCDLQTNVTALHNRVYGESRYAPSETVKSYSKALETETDLHYEDKAGRPEHMRSIGLDLLY